MNKRFPFPKIYWVYVLISSFFAILFILNIFRTDGWMGEMPFSEYGKREWTLFAIFVIEELVITIVMGVFACLGGKIYRKRESEMTADRERNKFAGIKSGDFDYIWFDFGCIERALILKQGEKYMLSVHEYDDHTGKWQNVNQVDSYDSLKKLKEDLFFEFDFYCEENAILDKHGNEMYKETNL